jgi:hypothetical protein
MPQEITTTPVRSSALCIQLRELEQLGRYCQPLVSEQKSARKIFQAGEEAFFTSDPSRCPFRKMLTWPAKDTFVLDRTGNPLLHATINVLLQVSLLFFFTLSVTLA